MVAFLVPANTEAGRLFLRFFHDYLISHPFRCPQKCIQTTRKTSMIEASVAAPRAIRFALHEGHSKSLWPRLGKR